MKRFSVLVLLALVCASPAFAWHKKPHKDPRVINHPKAYHPKANHPKNPNLKHHSQHKTS